MQARTFREGPESTRFSNSLRSSRTPGLRQIAAVRGTAIEPRESTQTRPTRPRQRVVGSAGTGHSHRAHPSAAIAGSVSSSRRVRAACRSAVSKPSVNQPRDRGEEGHRLLRPALAHEDWAAAAVMGNDLGPASRPCSSSLAPFRPVGEGMETSMYVPKSRADDVEPGPPFNRDLSIHAFRVGQPAIGSFRTYPCSSTSSYPTGAGSGRRPRGLTSHVG
jgi:hypothetical protein